MYEDKTHGYNLSIEKRNSIWRFVVTDSSLRNKNGSFKDKVLEIANMCTNEDNFNWDLIIHKGMVAFKLPTERTTYIYSKTYWDDRCYQNLKNLKVLGS